MTYSVIKPMLVPVMAMVLFGAFAMSAQAAATGAIVSPEADEIVFGEVALLATYDDGDEDNDDVVNWAVRSGDTCSGAINNVFGNVGGMNDPYEWDGKTFAASIDTAGLPAGVYCFIFNPTDDPGDGDVRETQLFYVASEHVSGGGQILEKIGKKKFNWHKISFGGWVADIGELVGDWQINFHNTGDDVFDGGKFHATEFVQLNVAPGDSPTCTEAMNFVAHGTYNGEEGWSVVVRAGDSDNAASKDPDDTVRVQLFDSLINTPLTSGHVYDTHTITEFVDEANCVGSARTGLDNGNIDIVTN